MKKKTSPIWLMPTDQFRALVSKSQTIADIIRYFGFAVTGKAFKMIKERLRLENIDYSHISLGIHNRLGKKGTKRSIPLDEVMIENSTYHYGHLKERLLVGGLLRNECYICGQKSTWNGLSLVMVMDHINGTRNDHRLENLRMLCPNCNSQTKTFSGRNCNTKSKICMCCGEKTDRAIRCRKCYDKVKVRMVENKCVDCGVLITSNAERCYRCNLMKNGFVKNKPTKDELIKMVNDMSWVAIGRKYGVSDNAIRRWARKYGLIA